MKAGDVLPALERHLDAAALVAYAGATWDWYRIHYDADAAAAAGLPRPLVDGQMLGALLAEQVQDWAGPTARLRTLRFRFASMVFAGDTIRVTGEVAQVSEEGDRRIVVVEQRIVAGERTAVAPAQATVEVPAS